MPHVQKTVRRVQAMSAELSVEEVRWDFAEEPDNEAASLLHPSDSIASTTERIYLDQIFELGTQLSNYRTMVQVLLETRRDQEKQLKHYQTAQRELRAHVLQ